MKNLLPLDPAKITVASSTDLTYENFSCAPVSGSDGKELRCSLTITAAVPTQKLVIQATDAINTTKQASIMGYLIDRIEPEKGQLDIKIEDPTNKPNEATVKMTALPQDRGGAGTDHCELVYTKDDGSGATLPVVVGTNYNLVFQNETVHTINLLCYDKAGNYSTNEFKFPPIITFDPTNITLSKEVMSGRVMIYSPSNKNIESIILVDDPGNPTQAVLKTCKSQIDDTTIEQPFPSSFSLQNTPEKPIICEFNNIKNTGTILIKAKDQS